MIKLLDAFSWNESSTSCSVLARTANQTKFFELTELGKRILSLNYKSRQLEFVKLILSHKVFHMVIRSYFYNSEMPSDY